MKIARLVVGNLMANCYIAACMKTKTAAVIDPGGDPSEILAYLKREGLKVAAILNTHGHVDHIAGNMEIKKAVQAPLYIHAEDAAMLTSAQKNLSAYTGGQVISPPADKMLGEGDTIPVGEETLTVLHTPGHTKGGVCFLGDGVVFSGDTLFADSVGRSDFPGGSASQLIRSIREKLLALPDETRVLPGHGDETTIGRERRRNPFLQP